MKFTHKALALMMCVLFVFGLASCGKKKQQVTKSSDNSLSYLKIKSVDIVPDFDGEIVEYAASVPYETDSLEFDYKTEYDKATVDISENASKLEVGMNVITITVTAEDGSERIYTLNILKEAEKIIITEGPVLSSLSLDIKLDSEFDPTVSNYYATVKNDVENVSVDACSADPDVIILVTGQNNLFVGENTIKITLTKDDLSTTYTITVYRLAVEKRIPVVKDPVKPVDNNVVDSNNNSGSNSSDITSSEDNSSTVIPSKPTVSNPSDDNTTIPSTPPSQETQKSGVNTLSSLSLSNGTSLVPEFNSNITTYEASVSYLISSLQVTCNATDSKADVSIVNSSLTEGINTITISVTAENGDVKIYTINVTRRSMGLDVTNMNNLVGICYSTWFDPINKKSTARYSQKLISGFNSSYYNLAGADCFYYWAKPQLGFYNSSDKEVIKTHMRQLQQAGVDFIIIDNTNAMPYWTSVPVAFTDGTASAYWDVMITAPVTAILDTCVSMRREGESTPYIVFWNRAENDDSGWNITKKIYSQFYKTKYKDLFVYWDGLPFFLTTNLTTGMPSTLNGKITVRKMWGLRTNLATSEWSFLNIPNIVSKNSNNNPEQICVCVAGQKTYMSNTSTATGRNHGITFYNQWLNAFKYRPKFVTLTWWNEWAAQAQYVNGSYQWTDAYNQEYSRDIEPMQGGHGDQYYRWMCEYIDAYKNNESCPRLVESGY